MYVSGILVLIMSIDERRFINNKRDSWEQLSRTVERVKTAGLKSLTGDELTSLGSLYRRAAADLSYARAQDVNPNLLLYLNELVGNAHGLIYCSDAKTGRAKVAEFVFGALPATLRRRMPFIFAAFALAMLGGVISYAQVSRHLNLQSQYIDPGMKDSFDAWKEGFADHGDITAGEGIAFSSSLMTHNIGVGLVSWATGVTILIPAYFMYTNGAMMGVLAAVVQPTHHLATMWAGILPHGVFELSAIFICGGAGLAMGWALIVPGERTRQDSLVHSAKDATRLLAVAVPLFVIAGLVEGNVSHASLPHVAKFTFAAFEAIMLWLYVRSRYVAPA